MSDLHTINQSDVIYVSADLTSNGFVNDRSGQKINFPIFPLMA